jgi:hypothetical protein
MSPRGRPTGLARALYEPARNGPVSSTGRRDSVPLGKGFMVDSSGEFKAASLFCSRCKRATPVRKQLLLVLPTGHKYDYVCGECGTQVGGKTDSDSQEFHRWASSGEGLVSELWSAVLKVTWSRRNVLPDRFFP